ncbi:IPT/TIG domain-containing protein [Pseudoclavibacter sp. RFBG4]|uniref:IPT/TIG domain-containing protein n=1 Tax=Pseudoclavibacter sp. RFBG4 TaxID=2080575 RepID=UPI0015E2893A|nr:IPT/TIG domain-containing protein [Pseudoclavibacter sp. RFBG4]
MSDGNARNVFVGVVGGVFSGPETAAYPQSHGAAIKSTLAQDLIAANIRPLGHISTDGVTQTIDQSTTKLTAWGNYVLRTIESEHAVTYQYKLVEHNENSAKEFYGDDATVTEQQIKSGMLPIKTRVLVVRDGNRRMVVVIPRSQVIARGDQQMYGEDAVSYDMTIEAYEDEHGVKAYIYRGDVEYVAPAITDLDPATGPDVGGEAIRIVGTGFVTPTSVTFAGVPALAFNAISSTEIVAVTPPGDGATQVQVRAAGGASTPTADSIYTFA